MKKLMIVDDNTSILNMLKEFLQVEKFEIECFDNAEDAFFQIALSSPDIVISDIKMEPLNGIEFLKKINNEYPDLPVILMTGFANLLIVDEAIKMGAYSLIKKPFDFSALIETIKMALGQERSSEEVLVDNDFYRIDLDRFVSGASIPCSIFIKIRSDHYIKIAHKGEPIPRDSINKYKEKDLRFLHVLKEEYTSFVGFNLNLMDKLGKNDIVENEKALNFINYTNAIILERTFLEDLSENTIDEVLHFSKLAISILSERKSMLKMLQNLADTNDYLYAHSLSVAIMSYLIAKKLEWDNESTLMKVYMAGLLHDIGLKFIPRNILEKNHLLMSDEERRIYETHPTRGMEGLNAVGGIPEEVILAAYQHHEDCTGQGYPLNLLRGKTSPISKVISCADIIDDYSISDKRISVHHYRKALTEVIGLKENHYEKRILMAMKSVLKME